jgi:iduronate 2-sulfatase
MPRVAMKNSFNENPFAGILTPHAEQRWGSPPCPNISAAGAGVNCTPVVSLNTPLPAAAQETIRRGYYKAVAAADQSVGELIDGLKKLRVYNSTILVVHGDHGYSLGESGAWAKFSLFEAATRTPLWIKGVGGISPPGNPGKVQGPVELVNLYATIADLVNARGTAESGVSNQSFAGLVTHPHTQDLKGAVAFSQFPRSYITGELAARALDAQKGIALLANAELQLMGYSVRSSRWRFTVWYMWDADAGPSYEEVVDREMYDMRGGDVDSAGCAGTCEDVNVYGEMATDPKGIEVIAALTRLIEESICNTRARWCRSVPVEPTPNSSPQSHA